MRLSLVPESGRRDIRLLVVVASVMAPSQVLYRDLQVLVEAYRVKDMPAVQPESGHRTVQPVGTDYLVHAGIGGGELLVLARLLVLEIVRAAEVVLNPGPADSRIFPVTVHVELDFPLTPPAVVVYTPCQVGTHVLSLALHTVNQRVQRPLGRIGAAELRVEVGLVLRNFCQGVVDLVVQAHHLGGVDVLQRDTGFLAERHLPVAVEGAARIHADGQ